MQGDSIRLTIADARTAALRSNPELRAVRTETAIAQGQLRQASAFRFNPGTDLLGGGTGGSSPEIGLTQEIEIGGQRSARTAGARAGVSRAQYSIADALRLTLAEVDRDFYRTVASDRRAALAAEVLALNERLAQVATKQLREGEISKLDYNLSIVELGRSRARSLSARREQQQSMIELKRLIGLPSPDPVVAVYDSTVHRHVIVDSMGTDPHVDFAPFGEAGDTTLAALVVRAVLRRPDLAARNAELTQATADVALARREALPNLAARLLSQRNEAGTGRTLRPGIGISIPIFNRNHGEVDARRAMAERVSLERSALVTRVRADVESAMRAYLTAAGEVEVLERTVLGPARDNRRLLETAYREGKVGLPVLLLIRNQVSDAEQDYWTAWLAERIAAADLTAAIGSPLSIEPRNNREQ